MREGRAGNSSALLYTGGILTLKNLPTTLSDPVLLRDNLQLRD
jgi:hypothetical protein